MDPDIHSFWYIYLAYAMISNIWNSVSQFHSVLSIMSQFLFPIYSLPPSLILFASFPSQTPWRTFFLVFVVQLAFRCIYLLAFLLQLKIFQPIFCISLLGSVCFMTFATMLKSRNWTVIPQSASISPSGNDNDIGHFLNSWNIAHIAPCEGTIKEMSNHWWQILTIVFQQLIGDVVIASGISFW